MLSRCFFWGWHVDVTPMFVVNSRALVPSPAQGCEGNTTETDFFSIRLSRELPRNKNSKLPFIIAMIIKQKGLISCQVLLFVPDLFLPMTMWKALPDICRERCSDSDGSSEAGGWQVDGRCIKL